jgi:chemotaxis protein CheD
MSALASPVKKIHVIQGEFHVVRDENVVLMTILGSCVAACMRDSELRIGGMNHFLLPGGDGRSGGDEAERYGVHLMELLVNALLKSGAHRDRLECKLFGGARVVKGLSDIGAKNASFAHRFLRNEGVKILAEDLGGDLGRRLEYYPVSGRARQTFLSPESRQINENLMPAIKLPGSGAVELF